MPQLSERLPATPAQATMSATQAITVLVRASGAAFGADESGTVMLMDNSTPRAGGGRDPYFRLLGIASARTPRRVILDGLSISDSYCLGRLPRHGSSKSRK